MALSTIGTAAIADDAITSAKVDSTTTAFTVADSLVPLINNNVKANKITKAGAFKIPEVTLTEETILV